MSLYLDHSSFVDGVVGVVYFSILCSGPQNGAAPKEELWKKTLKCEFPGVIVEKMKESAFYYPKQTNDIQDEPTVDIPQKYQLEVLLEDEKDPNKAAIRNHYFGHTAMVTSRASMSTAIDNTHLQESAYMKEFFFGYLDKNGANHPVLSDRFDYSVGKEEILKRRALAKYDAKFKNKLNYFDLMKKKSEKRDEPPIPFYTIDTQSLQQTQSTFSINTQANTTTTTTTAAEAIFSAPTRNDPIVFPTFQTLSHLAHYQHDSIFLINGATFREEMIKEALVNQRDNMTSTIRKRTTQRSQLNGNSGANAANTSSEVGFGTILKHLTTFRFKILMSVKNFHYAHYNIKPPNYSTTNEELLEATILRQKRKYDCLPQIRWDEHYKRPKSPKIYKKEGAKILLLHLYRLAFDTTTTTTEQFTSDARQNAFRNCRQVCRAWYNYIQFHLIQDDAKLTTLTLSVNRDGDSSITSGTPDVVLWLPPLLTEKKIEKFKELGITLPINIKTVQSRDLKNITTTLINKRRCKSVSSITALSLQAQAPPKPKEPTTPITPIESNATTTKRKRVNSGTQSKPIPPPKKKLNTGLNTSTSNTMDLALTTTEDVATTTVSTNTVTVAVASLNTFLPPKPLPSLRSLNERLIARKQQQQPRSILTTTPRTTPITTIPKPTLTRLPPLRMKPSPPPPPKLVTPPTPTPQPPTVVPGPNISSLPQMRNFSAQLKQRQQSQQSSRKPTLLEKRLKILNAPLVTK